MSQVTIRREVAKLMVWDATPTLVSMTWIEPGNRKDSVLPPPSGVGYTFYAQGLTVAQVEQIVTSLQPVDH